MFIVERTLPCSEPGCAERRMVNANGGVFPRCEGHQRSFWALAAAARKESRTGHRKELIKKGDRTIMANQAQLAAVERSLYEKMVQLSEDGDSRINLNSLKGMFNRGYVTDMGAPEITPMGRAFMREYAEANRRDDLPEYLLQVGGGTVVRENGTVYHEVVTSPPSTSPPTPLHNGEGSKSEIMTGGGEAEVLAEPAHFMNGRVDVSAGGDQWHGVTHVSAAAVEQECEACERDCAYKAVVEMLAEKRPEVAELVETMLKARRLRDALKL